MLAILLAVAAQGSIITAAYTSGRCYVHLSDDAKAETVRQLEAQAPEALPAYYDGIERSRLNQPTREQCRLALAKAEKGLQAKP